MERPYIVQSGILQAGDTPTIFPDIRFPNAFSGSDVYLQKIKGYLGFRCDLVFRLVVNASRFMSGRYMLIWFPSGGSDLSITSSLNVNFARNWTLVQRTQMPHAEIDINCDTEVIFKVPYSSVHNFCLVSTITENSNYSGLGTLKLVPYYPLQVVSGPTNCSYTIYANMENVQLLNAAVPQSRMPFVRKGRNETELEQDSGNIGPLSSMLINVRDASAILAKVPLLSSYATTTSWFADRMAHVASTFGFSRPTNLASTQRITRNIAPYIANADGMDNSWPLSLSYKNEVARLAGDSVTDIDEMDMSFLVTIPTWRKTVNWTNTMVSGTLLDDLRISPRDGVGNSVINTSVVENFSPMAFLAVMFEKWRGSFVVKMKFVKTEFHTGRILVVYSPTEPNTEALVTPSLPETSYIHREIIDIRECNEVTLTIPYVSMMPWRQTTTAFNGCTGRLSIFVLDKLVYPDTVPNNVQILLETCGGPDMEFAVPKPFHYMPFMGPVPQSSFPTLPNNCSIADKTIGTSRIAGDGDINALYCIGEKISNLRILLKKPNFIANLTPPTANIFTNVIPFLATVATRNGITNEIPTGSGDLYSVLSAMYVYSRGGVRLKFIPTTNVACPLMMASIVESVSAFDTLVNYSATDHTGNSEYNAFNRNLPTTVNLSTEVTEVQVPQYHYWPRRSNSEHFASGSTFNYSSYYDLPARLGTPLNVTYTSMDRTAVSLPRVYRAGAEDTNFSYFTCIPPLVVTVRNA